MVNSLLGGDRGSFAKEDLAQIRISFMPGNSGHFSFSLTLFLYFEKKLKEVNRRTCLKISPHLKQFQYRYQYYLLDVSGGSLL